MTHLQSGVLIVEQGITALAIVFYVITHRA